MTMSFFKRKSEHHQPHKDENAQQQQNQQSQGRIPRKMSQSGSMNDLASQGLPQTARAVSASQPLRNMPGGPNGVPQQTQRSTMMDGGSAFRDGQQPASRPRSSSIGPVRPGAAPPTYPWSARPLLNIVPNNDSQTTVPSSPFPRYGPSVPAQPTQSGHLIIFGGLVGESTRNDLYALDCRDFSIKPLQAHGTLPPPRVGHRSALVQSVFIVWGGDTKKHPSDIQDEALHLLNIQTKEWTRVLTNHPRPRGRYGHAVAMHDSSFYVFGGQVDGSFMNDMWVFDLNSLAKVPQWHQVTAVNKPPPARTGHIMIIDEHKLYIFGGTDGAFHYNDTWCFDLATNVWTELQCIGYVPVAREGCAASLVDGVMYVFGGRDVNGKDLGDLAAFKISNRRWYMFQNMGPSPSGRSGHAMSANGKQIVVLGGDANDAFVNKPSDPTLVHVLDTGKIKYPPEVPRPNGNAPPQIAKKSSMPAMRMNSVNGDLPAPMYAHQETVEHSSAPPSQIMRQTLDAPEQGEDVIEDQTRNGSLRVMNGPALAPPIDLQTQHPPAYERSAESTPQMTDHSSAAESAEVASPPDEVSDRDRKTNERPQRPRRDGDETLGELKAQQTGDRAFSPQGGEGHNTPRSGEGLLASRIRTSLDPTPRNESPTSSLREAWTHRSNGRTLAKSPPPADAFYYGTRSPTGDIYGSDEEQSLRAHQLRRQAELEETQRRCQTLSTVVGLALTQGLELPRSDLEDLSALTHLLEADRPAVKALSGALLKLQESHMTLKNQLLDEKSRSNEHFQESENLRLAAIQEAAYLRARLTAIESGNRDNITQLGTDRQQELEERLSAQLSAKAGLETQVGEAHLSLERLQVAVRQLEEEERRASDRATVAEQDCHSLRRELAELHSWKIEGDKTAREHANREISLSSTLQQHEAERTQFEEQLQRFQQERGEHMQLIEEAKQAMSAASEQAIHWQNSHATASQTIDQLQAEVARLKREADESRAEKEASIARSQDLEKAWNLSKQESASLRKLGDNRIQELLQTHRSTSSQDTSRGQREKFQAVSQECASLRKMLNEAGLQVSHAQSDAMQHRETVLRLEEEREHLRAELDTMKHSVRANHSELERVQQLASSREADAQRSKAKSADLEIRCAMLRNLLVDHGIATDEETETHTPNSSSSVPSQLRAQLEDQAQQLKDSQNEILSLRRQLQDFSSREETLNRRLSVSRSPALGSAPFESLSSPATPQMPSRMAEDQADYHRMKQLEKDYREAVAYVKNFTKVYEQLKRDNAKNKERSDTLAAQLATYEGANGTEAGSRTRVATSGRNTPTFDPDTSRKYQKLLQQHSELARKHDVLQEELAALREVCTGREREVEVTRRRATDAETQIAALREDLERLESRMTSDGRPVDHIEQENGELRHENDNLRHENDSLHHKIGLLLDVNDSIHGTPAHQSQQLKFEGDGERRSLSIADSEEHKRVVESLSADIQDWQRRYGDVLPSAETSTIVQPAKGNDKNDKRFSVD